MGIRDKQLICIIKAMLKAPIVMPDGKVEYPECGTPQGGLCKARHKLPYAEQDIMRRKADLQAYILHFQNNNSA